MNQKTKVTLLVIVAAIMLVWGLGMKDGDKDGGYSDETTYYSAAELKERQRVIEEMAKMRGETPKPTATAEPEKEEKLDTRFESIELKEVPQSFTLSAIGYDAEQQIILAEFNMTELLYVFYDVPQEEWDKLNEAADFDKWFDVMIMKKFKFEQLN